MEIKISKDDYQDGFERNRVRWNLAYKKNLLYFTFYALAGLFVLAIMALGAKNMNDFWGVGSSLGLAIIFLSVYYFLHAFQNKRKFLARIRALTARSNTNGQHTELILKDDLVTYRDAETYSEWKWSVFSSYMLYQDYLFLLMGNSALNSIMIKNNEVTADEFAELINFCRGHLRPKK